MSSICDIGQPCVLPACLVSASQALLDDIKVSNNMQQLSQTYRKLSKRLVFAEISSQVHFFESEHAIQTPLQIPKNGFTGRPGAIGLNAQVLMEPHETKKRVKGAACDKKPRSDCWLEM